MNPFTLFIFTHTHPFAIWIFCVIGIIPNPRLVCIKILQLQLLYNILLFGWSSCNGVITNCTIKIRKYSHLRKD